MQEDMDNAGLLRRGAALLADGVMIILAGTVITEVLTLSLDISISYRIAAAILALPYIIIAEAYTNQTLGKKALGIEVLKENGDDCGVKSSIIRNLLRFVDVLPNFYLLGILVIAATDNSQRIGDIMAKTVVVRK